MQTIRIALVLAAAAAAPTLAQETEGATAATGETAGTGETASARFVGADGADHGSATLTQTPVGVLIRAELTGLPPGAHGFHIHESGVCEPPFESAGDHFNPTDAPHGLLVEGGPHAGDMPNIHVGADGTLTTEVVNPLISLVEGEQTLFDDDGAAILVHAMPDDYESDPSGMAGDRIACAVIEPG